MELLSQISLVEWGVVPPGPGARCEVCSWCRLVGLEFSDLNSDRSLSTSEAVILSISDSSLLPTPFFWLSSALRAQNQLRSSLYSSKNRTYLSRSLRYSSELMTMSWSPSWKLLICLTRHSLAILVALRCDSTVNFSSCRVLTWFSSSRSRSSLVRLNASRIFFISPSRQLSRQDCRVRVFSSQFMRSRNSICLQTRSFSLDCFFSSRTASFLSLSLFRCLSRSSATMCVSRSHSLARTELSWVLRSREVSRARTRLLSLWTTDSLCSMGLKRPSRWSSHSVRAVRSVFSLWYWSVGSPFFSSC